MNFEPKTSVVDSALDFGSGDDGLYELAPGVLGYAIEKDGEIYIPTIVAVKEGAGDVGRFLDSLSARCLIPNVTSPRLRGMLERRGWTETIEMSPEFEPVDIWSRILPAE